MITAEIIERNLHLIQKVNALRKWVGDTPLVQVKKLFSKPGVQIYAKHEWNQLSGSVKCRPAYFIIRNAIATGALHEGKILLDATSGNTGIAYGSICSRIGIGVALCLPENASSDRIQILKSFGAKIMFTSRFEGTDGAQAVAAELAAKHPDKYFYADQYKNENNWKAHYSTTATEIFSSLPSVTHFVAGLGTTGTFIGTGRRLKELNASIHLTSLQPDSPLHALEGWKHLDTALVSTIYDSKLADENIEVSTEEAFEILKAAAKYEELFLSPSSAANLVGAIRVAEKIEQGIVVTILPDNADKYTDVIKQLT